MTLLDYTVESAIEDLDARVPVDLEALRASGGDGPVAARIIESLSRDGRDIPEYVIVQILIEVFIRRPFPARLK